MQARDQIVNERKNHFGWGKNDLNKSRSLAVLSEYLVLDGKPPNSHQIAYTL